MMWRIFILKETVCRDLNEHEKCFGLEKKDWQVLDLIINGHSQPRATIAIQEILDTF